MIKKFKKLKKLEMQNVFTSSLRFETKRTVPTQWIPEDERVGKAWDGWIPKDPWWELPGNSRIKKINKKLIDEPYLPEVKERLPPWALAVPLPAPFPLNPKALQNKKIKIINYIYIHKMVLIMKLNKNLLASVNGSIAKGSIEDGWWCGWVWWWRADEIAASDEADEDEEAVGRPTGGKRGLVKSRLFSLLYFTFKLESLEKSIRKMFPEENICWPSSEFLAEVALKLFSNWIKAWNETFLVKVTILVTFPNLEKIW